MYDKCPVCGGDLDKVKFYAHGEWTLHTDTYVPSGEKLDVILNCPNCGNKLDVDDFKNNILLGEGVLLSEVL